MIPSNYLKWPFYAIFATLFSQIILHSAAHGNTDAIYREMHEKLHYFEKLVHRIVEEGQINSFVKQEFDKIEKNIVREEISKNTEISKIIQKLSNEGMEILNDYLTLKQKVQPSLIVKWRTKWEQIRRPLNEQDGKFYTKHDLEEIQKKANNYYSFLKFLEARRAENVTFFKRLAAPIFGHHLYADVETKKIRNTFTDLYDYVYLMAGTRLLKGVHNNFRREHPAAAVRAKGKRVDHARMIKIRALTAIVDNLCARLRRELFHRMDYESVPDDKYPSIEQRDQILIEADSILKMQYGYSSGDDKRMDEAKSRFESKLDTMMQVKRVEPEQMPEYLGELLFDEWAKTNLGKTMGNKNDADKLMAEAENAMKMMEIEEETASSNTGDLKANAKGKEKMEE